MSKGKNSSMSSFSALDAANGTPKERMRKNSNAKDMNMNK